MALKIRLARAGAKKRPFYRVVLADSRAPRDGRFIERLGTYDPLLPKEAADRVKLNPERIAHWLKAGAQPTDRVLRFLDAAGLATRPARNNPNKGKPHKKALERLAAKEEAAAPTADAVSTAAEEASAADAAGGETAAETPSEAGGEEATAS